MYSLLTDQHEGANVAANDGRNLRLVGELFCRQYNTVAKCYIEPPGSPGPRQGSAVRHLIVQYTDGRPEFAAGIVDEWSDEDVMRLLLSPNPSSSYPVWEIPARAYGRPMLFNSPGLVDPNNPAASQH
jgi:hypothetical protein